MADDTREQVTVPTNSDVPSAIPPKKFPKGVVLGKDGKPCRSCTPFSDWVSQTKKSTRSSGATTNSSAPLLSNGNLTASDCPPDVEALGRSSWTLLHSITASYPERPSSTEQSNVRQFLSLFAKLYPCWVCAEDFQEYMQREKVRTESRAEFGQWMCEAHNEVNRKLGKETFDCAKWEERWRIGWKDGRCD